MHPRGFLHLQVNRIPLVHILGQGLLVLVLVFWQVYNVVSQNPFPWSLALIFGFATWLILSIWVLGFCLYNQTKATDGLLLSFLPQSALRFWKVGSILILWQCIATFWQMYTLSFPQKPPLAQENIENSLPVQSIHFPRSFLSQTYERSFRYHTYDLLRLYKILDQSQAEELNHPSAKWQIDSLYQRLVSFSEGLDTLTVGQGDTSGFILDSLIRADTVHHQLLVYFLENKIRGSLKDSTQLEKLPQILEDTLQNPGLLYPALQELIRYHQGLGSLQRGERLRDSLIKVLLHENFQIQVRKVAHSQYKLIQARFPESFPKFKKWIPKED